MRTVRNRWVLLAAVGVVLALAPAAQPFLQNTTSTGNGIKWASMPVTVVINVNGSDNVPGTTDDDAIRAAWTTIQGISTAAVTFSENVNAAQRARTDFGASNINLYLFDETGASGLFGASPSGAVAITPSSFQLNGSLISSDVVYNGRDFTFSTNGSAGTADIQSVTTHETEHLLGFDHTGDYTGTLFPITFDNVTRTPAPDDVAGISTVYPAANYNASYGAISGSVRRAAGSAVVGGQVVAIDTNGMVTATAYTSSAGTYTLRGLVPGGYTVYAEPIDGPLYNFSVSSLTQVDTDFSTSYLGTNPAPQVITVTAGSTAAAGQITVRPAISLNITSGTPVRATRGQTLSVFLSGTVMNTATGVSIPGTGVTITTAQILSASQVRLDLTIAANAPLGSRSLQVSVAAGGDFSALTGGLDILDASGNSVSYPTGGAPVPPSITTTVLPNGQVGVGYNQTIVATGGTTPYTWAISAGTLPTGLTLAAATGLVSGTPTATGTFNFTARVTDANTLSSTRALSIVIAAGALAITTPSLPNGQVGVAYNQSLAASGGTTPYTWTVASGALPTGTTLSGAGAITGTPTTAGTYNFTARVTDAASATATRALSSVIAPAALTITTSSLPNGQVGVAYSQSLAASGGTTPYTWAVASGALPTGTSLSSGGAITGTPTVAGTYNFTARVTDAASATTTRALSSIVDPTALTITTPSLPNGQVGVAYSQSLAASGGTTPYTWAVASGALPTGTTLSGGGAITGTPTAAATYNFTARVTDAASRTATRALSIVVNPTAASSGSEIAVGTGRFPSSGGWVQTFNDSSATYAPLGWLRLAWTNYSGVNGETRPACGDVDGDGKAEIVLGLGTYPTSGGWVAIHDDAARSYAVLRWIHLPNTAYNAANGETWVACGDVDGDGRAEIVIGQGRYTADGGNVWVYDDTVAGCALLRTLRLPWTAYNSANGSTYPACGDVDGDGRAEIVVGQAATGPGLTGGQVAVFDDATASYAFRQWITLPASPYNNAVGLTRPACGDLDGDGRAEIVVGTGPYPSAGGRLYVFDDSVGSYASLRTLAVSWANYNAANGETRPAVGDVDNDGKAEIVVGLGTYTLAGGWMQLFNDAAAGYGSLAWVRETLAGYNAADGQTWPAVGDFR